MENKQWLIDVNSIPESATAISTDGRLFVAWSAIVNAPTVDAVEVVHGRWIVKGQDVLCSHCYKEGGHNQWGASAFSDYCPNCGAKMNEV